MPSLSIFHPMIALAAWTFLVLLLIPLQRARALAGRRIAIDDFKLGESAQVPAEVSVVNRNYMNLLELPVLFYVVCLALHVTQSVSAIAVTLAWCYVGARVVHSLVHLTYNRVWHRLAIFALSNGFLITLWVLLARAVV